MPKQMTQGGLMSRLGDAGRKAVAGHKNDETTYGSGGSLPEGIDHGIAQLVDCKFGQYKTGDFQGEYFFYAAGVVVMPKEVNGIPVEGLRTSIIEPMCDTPNKSRKTIADHIAWVLNKFRQLGVDTTEIGDDDLEATAAALMDVKPYFRFRTWKGKPTDEFPDPRVNEEWGKVIENFVPGEPGGVTDNSAASAQSNSAPTTKAKPSNTVHDVAASADAGNQDAQRQLVQLAESLKIDKARVENTDNWAQVAELIAEAQAKPATAQAAPAAAPAPKAAPPAKTPPATPAPAPAESDEPDFDALGKAADAGDDAAITQLAAIAEESGVDHEQYAQWSQLAAVLANGGVEPEAEAPAEAKEFKPEVNDVYFFKSPGSREAKECQVTAVYPGVQTVNLRRVHDQKSFKSIPWAKLEQGA